MGAVVDRRCSATGTRVLGAHLLRTYSYSLRIFKQDVVLRWMWRLLETGSVCAGTHHSRPYQDVSWIRWESLSICAPLHTC